MSNLLTQLTRLFPLWVLVAIGLVLVSCCPGGTASNVIAYLAKANVALSVSMTALSTLAAVIFTPLFTLLLVGSRLELDGWALFLNVIKVVLVPVLLGILGNRYLHRPVQKILPLFPLIVVVVIALIIGYVISESSSVFIAAILPLLGAVFSLHLFGFVLGYLITKGLTQNIQVSRTGSIEVGMQNSGLGAYLAKANFPDPATAVPSAISALFHCMIGSVLAAWWSKNQ